ncbi:hypothetical protein DRO26_02295 [Candidatus Bathyarchaeota archaeon]|nr:MAG: hypothetical protein DRO26_02295 [Candidatus Bathyarchaeota archaeon]
MRPPGFEPGLGAWRAYVCRPYDERIENNGEYGLRIDGIESLLARFYEFCLVDLQLSKLTAETHQKHVKRFFSVVRKSPEEITCDDLRFFLIEWRDKPYYYANLLKALKVFFRDFLKRPEVVSSFKFPLKPLKPKSLPGKSELQRFFKHLKTLRDKTLFLLYATTGLRCNEVLSLELSDIDLDKRMIIPKSHEGRTKNVWASFFNEETKELLIEYLNSVDVKDKLFPISSICVEKRFREASSNAGTKITPQTLREWFACEMGRLGVPDRYVDAFCGRVPRSVLARHYTDFSPERLKEIYDRAGLKVLS